MRRGAGVVLVSALIALGAASCGDDDSERATSEPIRRVTQAADVEESYRFRVEFDVVEASEPGDPSAPIVQELDGFMLEGMVDPSRQAGTTKLSGFAFEPPSTSIAFRFMDGVAYADLSGSRAAAGPNFLPEGISWVSLDEDDPSAIAGLPISVGLGRFDPAGVLHLAGVIRARRARSEPVGGVETTVYRVVLDPARALRELPRAQGQAAEESLGELAEQPLPAVVWIDGKDRLRRIELHLDAGQIFMLGRDRALVATSELSDFGVDVDVEAPPPEETITLAEFHDLVVGESE